MNNLSCCEKNEVVNYTINFVCVKRNVFLVKKPEVTKKKSAGCFFTWACTAIWIMMSLAVSDCWWKPLLFSAPFFIPLLFFMGKIEKDFKK